MPSSQIQQDPPITSPIPTSTQHIAQLDINPAHTSHECLHSGSNGQFTHGAGAENAARAIHLFQGCATNEWHAQRFNTEILQQIS
jgi:hypothetical protein